MADVADDDMDKKPAAVEKKPPAVAKKPVKKSATKKVALGKTNKKPKSGKTSGVTLAIPKKKKIDKAKSEPRDNYVINIDDELKELYE